MTGANPTRRFDSPEALDAALVDQAYITDSELRMTLYLAMALGKPLLVEGPAGVGKTEIARALAAALDTRLIRLQCYEGLDAAQALYEWDYPRQLLEIRLQEAAGASVDTLRASLYSDDFLLERPLLAALRRSPPPVLLVDELDRADEAFESFLLEILSEWQISIPEYGTVRAAVPPVVVITGNRTRALAEATRRRCLYLWLDYPDRAKERAVLERRLPGIDTTLADAIVDYLAWARGQDLLKTPGLSETLDWAAALIEIGAADLDNAQVPATLGALFKDPADIDAMRERLAAYRGGH
ncbi:MoxR family ATPase [Endozoicomonas sp. G2_2]|uniref:AAA family ATPase n=1 Tax=Endozoicomonas sp. G2_2 TaxID=2821092 RepID=UPI001AD956CC|nr:MoxR family ATPase [Endozoicomonas sp. G2_2]MBO9470127.1 MoxR family ATPase [Endozoicomonas sp. G2_2]